MAGEELKIIEFIELKYIHRGLRQLKSTCGPHAMLSRFTVKHATHYASNWFNCLTDRPFRQSQASII